MKIECIKIYNPRWEVISELHYSPAILANELESCRYHMTSLMISAGAVHIGTTWER